MIWSFIPAIQILEKKNIVNQDPEEYTGNEKEARRLLKGLIKAWLHYGLI